MRKIATGFYKKDCTELCNELDETGPLPFQLCYIATRWSNLRQCAHQRRCPPLQGVAGAQDLHRKPTNNPWYIRRIYIYCLQSPWISHNFTLQKLCRCITLSLQNASCSSFKPVRYPAIQIFQWGAWLTHETNYSCIGAPRIPSACTGLRDGRKVTLSRLDYFRSPGNVAEYVRLTLRNAGPNYGESWKCWTYSVHHFKNHFNHKADYYKVCLQLQYFQLRSIQINSDQFSTSSASPTCQQGWWAAARGSCCIAASRSETVLASHSNALEQRCPPISTVWCRPRVALLALESNTVKTPVTEDWMLRSLLQRSCRAVEGRTWFNMVQHGWTRSSNLYLGPLMEFPSLTMTRMRLDASSTSAVWLLYSSRMSFSCLVCLVHHVSSRYLQKVGRIG